MSQVNVSKLRIDSYRYTKTVAALQIPVKFEVMPPEVGGALVKNRTLYIRETENYKQCLFVYCHELLHLILNHIPRGMGKDHEIWGIAIDHVVNKILIDMIKVVSYSEANSFGAIYFDHTVPDGPAELVYRELLRQKDQSIKQGKSTFKFGGLTFKIERMDVDGKKKTQHNYKDSEQPEVGKGSLSEFEQAMKSQGNLSSDVLREINNGFSSQLSWQKILSSRIVSYIGSKVSAPTYTRIPYYQLGMKRPIRLPGAYKKTFTLVTAFDTSGSISKDELSKFLVELESAQKYLSELWAYIIDCKIKKVLHNPTTTDIINNLQGNGGTDFRPVFKDIEERKLKPQLLVYFTDLYGSFPEKHPTYPVIWILVKNFQTDAVNVPFGTVYYID